MNSSNQADFTAAELRHYARHFALPQVGTVGQRRLKAASVLCIGAGGLGSPVAMYLAAAGVGRLGLVDPDVVETSNLHRQIMHGVSDVGHKKIDSARATLREINPNIEVVAYDEHFRAANAERIASGYDLLVDGTDNFPTRYLSNDVAYFLGIPNVYGSIFQFEGQVSVFAPKAGGPCYRCLFPKPPKPGQVPSCAEGGVFGVLPGIVGALQATEAIKLLLGIGEPLMGRLLHIDALTMRVRVISLRKDPQCLLCGLAPEIHGLIDYEQFCGGPAEPGDAVPKVTAVELAALLANPAPPLLIDVREAFEHELASISPSRHISLGELPQHMPELPRDRPIVLHCKSGARSEKAGSLLLEAGFQDVRHLHGGILAWANEVDPTMRID